MPLRLLAPGGKVCALAGRVEPRDYADTAAMLDRYSPAQLIGFARRLDPGLKGRDFADAGGRLDRMPDEVFAAAGLSRQDIAAVRERFAGAGGASSTRTARSGTAVSRASWRRGLRFPAFQFDPRGRPIDAVLRINERLGAEDDP